MNNGAIDAKMFNDANGEHVFVYAKVEPFLAELRADGQPKLSGASRESSLKNVPNVKANGDVRERIQKMIELYQQRAPPRLQRPVGS